MITSASGHRVRTALLGMHYLLVILHSVQVGHGAENAAESTAAGGGWQPGTTHRLKGLEVNLSKPVVVTRSKNFLWFPCVHRRQNGDLLALATNYADVFSRTSTASASWSTDGGLSWTEPKQSNYGDVFVARPDGETIWLPYFLYEREDGIGNSYQVLSAGSREPRLEARGCVISGFPKPDKRDPKNPDVSGFVFTGDAVPLKDGSYLAMLYGYFKGEQRCAIVLARSSDGIKWNIISVIRETTKRGDDGPSEASLCRLKDGRLMAVYRVGSYVAYGQSFSSDEGKTWTAPAKMNGPYSVQPSLAVLPDGTVALSGGRPGLFVWFNRVGDGVAWEPVDLRANHNKTVPEEYIHESSNITETTPFHHYRHETTSYTQIVALDDSHLLVIYDRGPHGGEKIEQITPESNSIWVARVTVKRRPQ